MEMFIFSAYSQIIQLPSIKNINFELSQNLREFKNGCWRPSKKYKDDTVGAGIITLFEIGFVSG
jgi:hypothetical protein